MLSSPNTMVHPAFMMVVVAILFSSSAATSQLPNPPYVHPGIIVSLPMLNKIRDDVNAKVEPVYTAYLSANTTRVSETVPGNASTGLWLADPDYKPQCQPLFINGSGWVPFKEDAFAAYTHALLWFIEQDARHAEKAIELMDGWTSQLMQQDTTPFINTWGLQTAWGTAVWPRAAEIIRHTYSKWPEADAIAFGNMMTVKLLPIVEHGASTNGNIGLAMTEASLHIGIYTDNGTAVNNAVALWRGQAPAYIYISSDGPSPKRPPAQPHLQWTSPVCGPNCTDRQMEGYWHGQKIFGAAQDGVCQESCRDLGHVQLGFATFINSAETAHHQGIDLYGENRERIIAGAEFHATLMQNEPAALQQKWPEWLCGGHCTGEHCGPVNGSSTWEIMHHHFTERLGLPLPNVSALLPHIRPTSCWDHICWETLTHGGSFNTSLS